MILRGKLVVERTMEELRGREGELLVRAEPLEEAARVARDLQDVEEAQVADGMLRITADPTHAAEINAGLVNAGVRVGEKAGRALPRRDVPGAHRRRDGLMGASFAAELLKLYSARPCG